VTTEGDALVAAARRLLAPVDAGELTPGVRARAAAILLRMALDGALTEYWGRVTKVMTKNGKHRMLCLEWYAGHETARRCRATWSALSAACHYRTYGLPPAPEEVRARLTEVTELLVELRRDVTSAT
jgi:hypothetical protein